MMNMRIVVLGTLLSIAINVLFSQGTIEDYNRAYSLREKYCDKVFCSGVVPHWIGHTSFFWYERKAPNGKQYILTDADKLVQRQLFDPAKLAAQLSANTGRQMDTTRLHLENVYVAPNLNTVRFDLDNIRWNYDLRQNKITKKQTLGNRPTTPGKHDPEIVNHPIRSPDGKKEASIKNHNIHIKDLLNGLETTLTQDGTATNYYSAVIEWSPDSKKIACMKVRPAEKRYLNLLESSPAGHLLPKPHKYIYPRAGDALPFRQPHLFNVVTGEHSTAQTSLFNKQYQLWNLHWDDDSEAITFEYNQRGHQVYRVLEMSARTGAVRILINETSKTYINYNRRFRYDLKNGVEIIWASERDNWNHLYLYNQLSGVARQITKGPWYVREIQYIDEQKRRIFFSANGINPNEDPYLVHYYHINMDGSGLTCLTPENGMHDAWYSDNKKYLVDVYSKTDVPPTAVLRSAKDGSVLLALEKADISALVAEGWQPPETFAAKGRDGQTDIWGLIFRPSNFNPQKKYPVIDYIYAAPGGQYVPKRFASIYRNPTPLAELGFIVVQIDGMGTSFRSKSFESICYKNLKDAGLPDRMAWIRAAAKKYPEMDLERVGIFGTSAGGQEAMTATLLHPAFYKAAYAACGCHDNRLGLMWWNEQWMGYPVNDSYITCSNVENANLLKTPLMLVVGEMDKNVDPSSTMQVVNALVKAGKDFELVVLPGTGHTMGEEYGEHKRFDFFVKNLLGVFPPSWDKVKTTPIENNKP